MKCCQSVVLLSLILVSYSYSQNKVFPQPNIEFNPPGYVCYKSNSPIIVDGLLDEKIWQEVEWTNSFVDIEGNSKPLPRFNTRAKMLWDDDFFYIAAVLEEPNLWATLKQRDTIIFYDNDFEVFIDPDGDSHKYYELEINAYKTAWDLLLIKPYRDADNEQVVVNSWNITGLNLGVHFNGTLNNPTDKDESWTCEIAIPWAALRESYTNESRPKSGEQWRVNFSRVEWKTKMLNGKYEKEINPKTNRPYPEDNWVWAPTGLINIHYPEMWGYVQFSDNVPGKSHEDFEMRSAEIAKWALRKLYYNEKTFFMNNRKYTSDISKLDLPEIKIEGYTWPPEIESTTNSFEARIRNTKENEIISIMNDGRIIIQK